MWNHSENGFNSTQRSSNNALENYVATWCIVLFALIGIAADGGAIIAVIFIKSLRDHFCYLYVVLTGADLGVLFVFLFWSAPLSYIGDVQIGFLGKKVGIVIIVFFFTSYFAQLSMAINRLVAVTFPMWYHKSYTMTTVKLNAAVSFMFGFVCSAVYFFPDCDFYFDPERFIWDYSVYTSCGFFTNIACSTVCVIGVSLVLVINLVTFFKLRRTGANMKGNAHSGVGTSSNKEELKKKRDFRFFIQSAINGLLYVSFAFSFHITTQFPTYKWAEFVERSILWQCAHITSGMVFLFMNQEIQKATTNLFRRYKSKIAPTHHHSTVSQTGVITEYRSRIQTM